MNISNMVEHRHSSEIASGRHHSSNAPDKLGASEPAKKDSVEISEEGKKLSDENTRISRDNMREAPFKIGTSLDISKALCIIDDEYRASHPNPLFRFGDSLVAANDLKDSDYAASLIKQSIFMVNASPSERLLNVSYSGETTFKDLESTAKSREAGKKLAEYIAENYFNDPDKAKAFMDSINENIRENEMRDENTLNFWVENEKKMRAISAQLHPQLQAQYPSSVAAPGQPKLDYYELLHVNAVQSLVIKGESVHDWFTNFTGQAKSSVQNMSIQDLLAKYSVKVA
jgi:hypothetical protein